MSHSRGFWSWLGALAFLLVGCSASVGTNGASADAQISDAVTDVAADSPGGDASGCVPADPNWPIIVDRCDMAGLAQCAAWARSQVLTGTGHSVCAVHFPQCFRADRCDGAYPPHCTCGDLQWQCGSDQVCVSATPGATPTCRPACQ